MLVDTEALFGDVHGYIACTDCHGGQSLDGATTMQDKVDSHEGIVRDPSEDGEAACGQCHPDIAPYQDDSLHNSLAGYDTVLYERSIPENHSIIEEGETHHCNSCHTTCGQCHISQPTSVGGGLVDGHAYNRTPSMSRQCTACHGSRIKNEYTGAHEGLGPDVHLKARMLCTDCHTGDEMHGTAFIDVEEGFPTHRYDGEQGPSCESCHEKSGVGSGNEYHDAHGTEILACQVCHSQEYINCDSCHLERTDEDVPYFRLEHEEIGFFIGRNPIRTSERPYRFVPVRHVPASPNLFELYGDDVFPNFESRPTWTYTTPHNTVLIAPQSESCESCHTNDDYFLTPDKVLPEEYEQNKSVIVLGAPPLPEEYNLVPVPESEEEGGEQLNSDESDSEDSETTENN